jgi:hypothetical protein
MRPGVPGEWNKGFQRPIFDPEICAPQKNYTRRSLDPNQSEDQGIWWKLRACGILGPHEHT